MSKKNILFLLVVAFTLNGYSQSTQSPYTRFGLGKLADPAVGGLRSMGGVSQGIRSVQSVNPYNPASYSDADSTNFVFDMGVSVGTNVLEENGSSVTSPIGGLDYGAIKFPIIKGFGASAGILPFSSTSYQFGTALTSPAGTVVYSGSGGLSQVYFGLGYNIFKGFSLGANVAYLFGTTENSSSVVFTNSNSSSTAFVRRMRTNSFKTDIGFQYDQKIGKSDRLIVGATFSPRMNLNSSYNNIVSIDGTETQNDTLDFKFQLPQTIKAGVSYRIKNQWTIAADAEYQDWSNSSYFSKTDTLQNSLRLAAGLEYQPNINSRNYFNRVKYRAGVHVSDSYFQVESKKLSEIGVGVGVALPVSFGRGISTTVNVGFDYSHIQSSQKGLMSDNNFRFSLSVIFNEYWFFKRRLE